MSIAPMQIAKTIILTVVGAAPGAYWLYSQGWAPASLIICLLGAFIGFALSLPGVSAGNVLRGTAGVVAAHNAPVGMRDQILEKTIGKPEDPKRTKSDGK